MKSPSSETKKLVHEKATPQMIELVFLKKDAAGNPILLTEKAK